MAQTLSANIGGRLEVAETLSTGFANGVLDTTLTPALAYVSGNSNTALALNASFIKGANTVTLNASANTTYTLTALTDDAGRSITLAGGVRVLVIHVTSRTAGDYLTVGAAGTNPWTSPFNGTAPALKVFDLLVLGVGSTDKYAVTINSNEQLKVTNSGSNPITFKLALLGCAS